MQKTNSSIQHSRYSQLINDITQMPLKKQPEEFIELIGLLQNQVASAERKLHSVENTIEDVVKGTGMSFVDMRNVNRTAFITSYFDFPGDREYYATFFDAVQLMLEKLEHNDYLAEDNEDFQH